MMPANPDDDPRFAILALVPLAVIALGAFVPPILLGHPPRPPEALVVTGSLVFWTVPAGAAVLAVLAITCRWRRCAPAGFVIALSVAAVVVVGSAPALVLYFAVSEEPAIAAAMVATLVAVVGFLAIAFRTRAWRRWMAILGAYAVVALPYGCRMIAAWFNDFPGGMTFVVADAALLALVVRALWRR